MLQALGLRPGLEAISLAPAFSLLRDAGSGFLLSQRPLGAFSDARYGAPCLVTTEQNLKKLLAASCEVHGVVRASEAVLEIEPETGTVRTDSNERHVHAAVVITTPPDSPLTRCVAPRETTESNTYRVVAAHAGSAAESERDPNILAAINAGACCIVMPTVNASGSPVGTVLKVTSAWPTHE